MFARDLLEDFSDMARPKRSKLFPSKGVVQSTVSPFPLMGVKVEKEPCTPMS
jgi:hypothetical protein